jgi:prevent-host-death family protein
MKERVLRVTEFKAKCLACLAEVEETGERITITKRGKPVAVVGPAKRKGFRIRRGVGQEGEKSSETLSTQAICSTGTPWTPTKIH